MIGCGIAGSEPDERRAGQPRRRRPVRHSVVGRRPAGPIDWANWPLYIDIDDETGAYPTLEKFTEETGIEVNYQEAINDNEEFFGRIQPDLAAGNPTGWDVDHRRPTGWSSAWSAWAMPSSSTTRRYPTSANLQPIFADQYYDPGNAYSLPWTERHRRHRLQPDAHRPRDHHVR